MSDKPDLTDMRTYSEQLAALPPEERARRDAQAQAREDAITSAPPLKPPDLSGDRLTPSGIIFRLKSRWGQIHIDAYPDGRVVVSAADVNGRRRGNPPTYEGRSLIAVLDRAAEGEGL